ncbi:MAG: hypothetical protein KAR38_10315 [Calditrichia bacterium]|nr:hypothetical protein [Calditrichia bacterium]
MKPLKIVLNISMLLFLMISFLQFSGCYTTFSSMQKETYQEDYYTTNDDNNESYENEYYEDYEEKAYYQDSNNPNAVYEIYTDSLGQQHLVEIPQEPAQVTNKYYNVDFYEYDPWDRPFYNSVYMGYPFVGDLGYTFAFSTYYWDDPWYWNYGPYWRHHYPYWHYPVVYDYYYPHYWHHHNWWYHDNYYGDYGYDSKPRNQDKRDWDKRRTARQPGDRRSPSERNTLDNTVGGTVVIGGSSGIRPASKTAIKASAKRPERSERTTIRKDRRSSSGKRTIIRRGSSRTSVDKDGNKTPRKSKIVKSQKTHRKKYSAPAKRSSGSKNPKYNKPKRSSGTKDKNYKKSSSKSSNSSKKSYKSSSGSSSNSRSSSVRSSSSGSSSRSSSSGSSSRSSSGSRGKKR